MAVSFATTTFEFATLSNASSYAKARGTSVGAGSLLFCFTMQAGSANTCTSVTDTLGNTYIKAFGPATAPAGDSSDRLYGWYAKNSSAGANTITANWSGSTNGSILIGEVLGLGGGGDLDVASSNSGASSGFQFSIGSTGTLAQAAEAGVMLCDYSGGNPVTAVTGNNWTDGVTPNWFNFDKIAYQITTTNASVNCTWDNLSNATSFVAGYMFFRDSGGAPLTVAASGSAITSGRGTQVPNITIAL